MKKSLLTILSAALSLSAFAQPTPSPDWATLQNTSFTVSAAGTRFLDAVSANDVWAIGYDGFAFTRNSMVAPDSRLVYPATPFLGLPDIPLKAATLR